MKKLTAIVLAMTLVSGAAHAALVKTGSVIYDESTGLDWMELTASTGQSYNSLAGQLGNTSSALYGYQFASLNEVKTLFNNQGYAGDFYNEVSDGASRAAVSTIFNAFGQTGTNCCERGDGMLLNEDGGNVSWLYYIPTMPTGNTSLVRVLDNWFTPEDQYWQDLPANKMGGWLVKTHTTAVPEPDVSWLAAFGALVTLVGLKKKKSKTR